MISGNYPSLYAPSDGYVFVVTYGRSGSTLLMKLLNSIPRACIRGENGNALTPLLRSIHDLCHNYNVNVRRAQLEKPLADRTYYWRRIIGTTDDPWFGAEKINADDYARSILDTFTRTILCPPQNVSLLGFKDIHFYKAGEYFDSAMSCMLRFFPNSKIIFLTRNLDDVSQSGWWKDMNKDRVFQELGCANDLFHSFHHSNKEKTMIFDYEEFFDRAAGVKRIFDFVGANFDRDEVDKVLDVRLNHLK